jgi:uncharacterized membrane protein YdbT with pleckstrin-like domain
MAYLDGLLGEGEAVLLKAHRHPLFLILHSIPYVLLVLVLWAAAIWSLVADFSAHKILGYVLLAVSLYPLARAVQRFLIWKREEYILTSYRILQVEGLLNKRSLDSALEKVNDVLLTQSIFGRMFDYGSIEIITGSDKGINNLAGIKDPLVFKRALIDAKKALERESRGVMAATAPERQQFAPAAHDDTMDAARLLAALTELRDSGVITGDEYETRKRELLRR